MFTLTAFEILLFEGRSVLWPTQWVTGSDKVKWKTQHNNGWSVLWAIQITVLSKMKKETGNLVYFDKKKILFSILKQKYLLKVDKKASNENTLIGLGLLNISKRNIKRNFEICLKLTIKTPDRRHWRRSGIFTVSFEQISHHALVFLLLTLSRKTSAS